MSLINMMSSFSVSVIEVSQALGDENICPVINIWIRGCGFIMPLTKPDTGLDINDLFLSPGNSFKDMVFISLFKLLSVYVSIWSYCSRLSFCMWWAGVRTDKMGNAKHIYPCIICTCSSFAGMQGTGARCQFQLKLFEGRVHHFITGPTWQTHFLLRAI